MKKILSLVLSALLVLGVFTGCTEAPAQDSGKLQIVTTIFPVYDWLREIVGEENDRAEVTLLLKNGVDLHSYQPSAKDLAAISSADVFVHVGGISDLWVADALKNEGNPNRVVINLFDILGDTLKPLPMTDGLEPHVHDETCDHHHEGQNDEHVWLSLPRAETAVRAIGNTISDHTQDEIYRTNAEAYAKKLEALDQEYRDTVAASRLDTLVFTDRFPFFYLTEDYGLHYYAAFTGCSAESEASFETVILLAQKIDELGIGNVLTIENRAHKVPETVIESTQTKDQHILILNSLQSVTEEQMAEGITYLDVMRSNLDVLKTALQ